VSRTRASVYDIAIIKIRRQVDERLSYFRTVGREVFRGDFVVQNSVGVVKTRDVETIGKTFSDFSVYRMNRRPEVKVMWVKDMDFIHYFIYLIKEVPDSIRGTGKTCAGVLIRYMI